MRILVHQPRLSYYIGGGETVPMKQAEMLSKLGHEIHILTSKPHKYSNIYVDFKKYNPNIGFTEKKLNDQSIYTEEPGKDWSRWDKEAILFGQDTEPFYSERPDFDLVVTHMVTDSLYVPRYYQNALHLHGVPPESIPMDTISLMRPDHFVAVSQSVKQGWASLYPELEQKNVQVCYNGIDLKMFKDNKQNRDIDLLYIGRMIPNKGIYQIVKALKILKDKDIDFNKLIMIGKGPELKKVHKMVIKLGLSNKVEFNQDLNHKELTELYNNSKIFLCPSYEREGVLTTMLEAASCGCAIVTANACGMPEFAKHNENSLLAAPKDVPSLSEMIEDLLINETKRLRLVKCAQKDLKEWDIQVTTSKLANIYKDYE